VSTPRGLSVKIIGVEGERLSGSEGDVTQDFVLGSNKRMQTDSKLHANFFTSRCVLNNPGLAASIYVHRLIGWRLGGLIQVAIGFAGGSGSFLTKRAECAVECDLAGGVDLVGLTVVHLVGRHQADTGMVMILIVPIKEAAAERLGVLNTTETLKWLSEKGLSLEVLWPAVGFSYTEIGEQQRGGLGAHRTAAIGM
jgi:hypothetical protein